MKSRTFNHLLTLIEKNINPGNLLDVGCAAGHLLETAFWRGWRPYGVELSEYAISLAKKKFSDHIYQGVFEDISLPKNFFDLVIMSDIIEHMINPSIVLRKVHSILREKGILAIITPNTLSLSAILLKSTWTHFKGEHLFYFNHRNISLFLKKNIFLPYHIGAYPKYLNTAYIHSQLTVYPHKLFTPLIKLVNRLCPERMRRLNFPVFEGDMLILSHRIS